MSFYNSYPVNIINRRKLLQYLIRHRRINIKHSNSIVSPALIIHLGNIDTGVTEAGGELRYHVSLILMEDHDTADLFAYTHIDSREVHGIFDISVLHIIGKLLHGHNRTIILGLLRRRSKMRYDNDALLSYRRRIREIRDILRKLPYLKR